MALKYKMADNFENFDLSEPEDNKQPTTRNLENSNQSAKQSLSKRPNPSEAAPVSQAQEMLKKLKQKVTVEKVEKKEPSKIAFKQIGFDEKIYKLSDLYLPVSARSRANQISLIESYSGLKDIKEFEKRCRLPPFDFNEAFANFEKNLRTERSGIIPKIDQEGPKALVTEHKGLPSQQDLMTTGLEFETKYEYEKGAPVNYVDYFEYFDELYRQLDADINQHAFLRKQGIEDYRELLKTVNQIRKEKVEEEQQRRHMRENNRKKIQTPAQGAEWNLEAMVKSNYGNQFLATPTLGPNRDERDWEPNMMIEDGFNADPISTPNPFFQNPERTKENGVNNFMAGFGFNTGFSVQSKEYNPQMYQSGTQSFANFHLQKMESNVKGLGIQSSRAKNTYNKFEQYFAMKEKQGRSAEAIWEAEENYMIAFKRMLNKHRATSNICVAPCEGFNPDLKSGNIFVYSVQEGDSKEPSQLRLDLYQNRKRTIWEESGNFNYKNPHIGSDMFSGPQASFIENTCKQLPYLDKNDDYVRAVIENYNEINLLKDKPDMTIVIGKEKRDKDNYMEQKAMQVKKIMRMKLARDNTIKDLSEDARIEILKNKDSQLRNLLEMNKTEDLNENEELLKNKKWKIKPIIHTKVAEDFELHDFVIIPEKIVNLYRNDITTKIIFQLLFERNVKWRFKIVRKDQEDLLRKRLKISDLGSSKLIQSHAIFNTPRRLSLKSDEFVLLEYIEKEPLILGDFSMGSRIEKWIYPTRLANFVLENRFGYDPKKKDKDQVLKDSKIVGNEFKTTLSEMFGSKGEEIFLVEKDKLPTVGQLTSKDFCGITLLDNNLSRTPLFIQTPKKTDFLLVCTTVKGEKRYFLRRIKNVYTAGQIQPKLEVFSPYSRQYNSFLRNFQKFYIKSNFERNNLINIDDMKGVFPTVNDHNLRRQLKLMGGDEDPTDKKMFYQTREMTFEQEEIAGDSNFEVTPEDVCLYYRMHQSMYKLIFFGIEELKSTDKISVLRTKFYRKNITDVEKTMIAKRVIEEILLSAWNVSQSFLSCMQNQGRMYLEGFGDPTAGNGGINFIKLPLKISRYESMLLKLSQRNKTNQIVTGTGSDLRCLSMKFVHKKLKQQGYNEEVLSNLERWDKIEILREIANKMLENKNQPQDEELIKFARNMRMTTEKQKEKYQMDINNLFMKMITTLSSKDTSQIPDTEYLILEEDLEGLRSEQTDELEKYKELDISDEEELAKIKPREIKKKTIVLKPLIKRSK